jgi:PleD family two-component response regulator
MLFGIKSAQETSQERMSHHFGHIPGFEVDIDDMLVLGETKEEHDQRLKTCLRSARR